MVLRLKQTNLMIKFYLRFVRQQNKKKIHGLLIVLLKRIERRPGGIKRDSENLDKWMLVPPPISQNP